MNIAIVGGGARCGLLLELVEQNPFQELHPKVVAVADERDDAPGVTRARKEGIFVTKDYNDLFERDDIDLIIELAGSQDVFYDILNKKKKTVRAFDHRTAQLFWEVSRFSKIQQTIELELEKTRTMYDVVINDLIEEDVMVITLGYQILDINDTMLNKLGLKREEVVGLHCYEISHHQDFPCEGQAHPCPLKEILNTKKPSQTTHVHLDKNGNELFYSISCYPIFDDGKVTGVVEISRDISKDINIQKKAMQQQKLASVGQLAAGVAHEINNPMTTILTSAMLIQEDTDPTDPNYKELQTIAEEALRCRKIVTSLLDFARQTKPAKRENSINNIVRESIILTKKQAAFKDVNVVSNLSENLPLIDVDKDQIQQSLINLALNAIESTDSGGKITFTTRLIPQDALIEILVIDTGKGISEQSLDKIFEPFFTTKETGTGLGLAITHGFIEQHGGTIGVESKLGQGTTFTVRLPIGKRDKDVD